MTDEKRIPTITIDMDRRCPKCGAAGMPCLKCAAERVKSGTWPMPRPEGEPMTDRQPDVTFRALVKTVKRDLKDEKDPETKEVIGHYVETKFTLAGVDLEDDVFGTLAALQGEGELIVEISRRQGALFKEPKGKHAEAH